MTGRELSSTNRRLTSQSWVLPVAPDAPLTGSKVSVMKPSTCGAKAATRGFELREVVVPDDETLDHFQTGMQHSELGHLAFTDGTVQLNAGATEAVAQGGDRIRFFEVGDQPCARTQNRA